LEFTKGLKDDTVQEVPAVILFRKCLLLFCSAVCLPVRYL